MYKLVNKEGNDVRITDNKSKCDELLRWGFRLVEDDSEQEPEQESEDDAQQESEQEPEEGELGEPKPRKRTSQSTAAKKKAAADKE